MRFTDQPRKPNQRSHGTRYRAPVNRDVVIMNGNKIITVVLVLAPYLLANAGDVLITSTTSTNLAATDRRQVNIYTRDGHRILQTEKTSSLGGNGWVLQQSIIWQDKTAVQLTTVAFETGTSHDIRFNAVSGIDAIADRLGAPVGETIG